MAFSPASLFFDCSKGRPLPAAQREHIINLLKTLRHFIGIHVKRKRLGV